MGTKRDSRRATRANPSRTRANRARFSTFAGRCSVTTRIPAYPSEPFDHGAFSGRVDVREQRFDHHVADQVHAARVGALSQEVIDGVE